jgi:hypothetical protein
VCADSDRAGARAIGFLPPFHCRSAVTGAHRIAISDHPGRTALPEEILFRGLIQNCIAQRFGTSTSTLLISAFIFGCAHLDNGPGPLPNWRYMILATIAGVAYGKVFREKLQHLRFSRIARAGGFDQARLLLIFAIKLSRYAGAAGSPSRGAHGAKSLSFAAEYGPGFTS